MKKRHPHRGIVLKLHEAAAIHRWLELLIDGRKFDNPIVCAEVQRDMLVAKDRLQTKLLAALGHPEHTPEERSQP